MSLEERAQELRQRGFTKQATLLESLSGSTYLLALLQKRWEVPTRDRFGDTVYDALKAEVSSQDSRAKEVLRLAELFQPRSSVPSAASLEISIEHLFDATTLKDAAARVKTLEPLVAEIRKTVFREVKHTVQQDEEVLFEAYKDSDSIVSHSETELKHDYENRLSRYLKKLKERLDDPQTHFLIDGAISVLAYCVPSFVLDPSLVSYMPGSKKSRSSTFRKSEGTMVKDAQRALAFGATILDNPEKMNMEFKTWLQHQKKTLRQRVLKEAREGIRCFTTADKYSRPPLGDILLQLEIHQERRDIVKLAEKDPIGALLKASLPTREHLLHVYETDLNLYFRVLVGAEQIVQGGPITNPRASPISIMQNHAHFPNLPYSDAVKARLRDLTLELQDQLDYLPDISDLCTPSKLKNRREHTYLMEELPKDPLDVTIGNDSKCCIFVPDNPKELGNGMTIPYFQLDPMIRFFALYRVHGETKQRMGLVVGFETKSKGNNVLACNSLELSRFGIAGGRATIGKITDYAESWLIGYGKAHGYYGVAMGGHSYNTSVNFSRTAGEKVEKPLVFRGSTLGFYSDIFVMKDNVMETRPNGCYWLWKK